MLVKPQLGKPYSPARLFKPTVIETLAHLHLDVPPEGLLTIGLVGDWSKIPDWLSKTLDVFLDNITEESLKRLAAANQLGLFQRLVEDSGQWSRIPTEYQNYIRRELLFCKILDQVRHVATVEIDTVFPNAGVRPTLLKGAAIAPKYYNHSWLRPVRDVDILVHKSEVATSLGVLRELHYDHQGIESQTNSNLQFSSTDYEAPPMSRIFDVELDSSVIPILSADTTGRLWIDGNKARVPFLAEIHFALEPDTRLPVDRIPMSVENLKNCDQLSTECNIVYLCYKAYTDIIIHRTPKSVKLLADVLRILRAESSRINWAGFWERRLGEGTERILGYCLEHLHTIYNLDMQAAILNEKPVKETDRTIDLGDILPFIITRDCCFKLRI